jgi:hypothetical protein
VDESRWHINHVTWRNGQPRKHRLYAVASVDGVDECRWHNRVASTEEELRIRGCVENDPGLMLPYRAASVQSRGKAIVGVHLYGESLVHVEELDEQCARRFVGGAEPGLTDRSGAWCGAG